MLLLSQIRSDQIIEPDLSNLLIIEWASHYVCSSLGSFTFGIWSESHDVLGVVDDTDILYFIKANGEKITRITKKHLKVSLPIMGLIVHDSSDMSKSCLCSFDVLTSDGSLHEVEISQDPSASVFSAHTSNNNSTLKEFPENVFCLNYHPQTSLLAIVGGAVSAPVTSSGNIDIITAVIDEVSSNTKPLIRQIQKLPKRVKKLMEMISHQEVNEEGASLFDMSWLLFASVIYVPIFQKIPGGSLVLGYSTAVILIGPYGLSIIHHVHGTKAIAEFEVVFLMFNIGLELSVERLSSMKKYVFGLGSAQVLVTAVVVGLVSRFIAAQPNPAAIIIGNGSHYLSLLCCPS
ncbi:hypothetical protein LOK49_LG14G00528 [Camellia lanceoleosa]|uniref:Uncharacterized protein n=1 Tax=Camellia lanceoleosa TaxID=1840588 RepID=A0ACC0F842_9ERIC|nr:hypothetical protein LOK49_LG14G00528 [Camellia lanceoleosa]